MRPISRISSGCTNRSTRVMTRSRRSRPRRRESAALPWRGGSPSWGKHEGLSRDRAVRGDGLHRAPPPLAARPAHAALASPATAAGDVKRKTIRIRLQNEANEKAWAWQIEYALPVKWTATDLDAQTSPMVMESLELAHHGLRKAT